ncbi:MAG: hypothetical protein JXX28_08575 [Deltaproteobacteria bacterium]|nr:hypothetical protein [Deltaproteobacteria bacterium]
MSQQRSSRASRWALTWPLALLGCGAPPPSPAVGFSVDSGGVDVGALLDPAGGGAWRGDGDLWDEALTFDFADPIDADAVQVRLCPGSAPVHLAVYADGAPAAPLQVGAGPLPLRPPLRRLALVVDQPSEGGCIAAVDLTRGGRSLGVRPARTVTASVSATSTQRPVGAYRPTHAFDWRLDDAWMEGAPGPGGQEALIVSLEEPLRVEALDLWNGYQRSDAHYRANSRLLTLQVEVDDLPPVQLPVEDRPGRQRLALPAPITGWRWTLRAGVVAVGEGEDLAITELALLSGGERVGLSYPDNATPLPAGHPASTLRGAPLHTPCEAGGTRLRLRPDGSFSLRERRAGELVRALDGSWEPDGSTAITLHGRERRGERLPTWSEPRWDTDDDYAVFWDRVELRWASQEVVSCPDGTEEIGVLTAKGRGLGELRLVGG